jgi:hypothetical protein
MKKMNLLSCFLVFALTLIAVPVTTFAAGRTVSSSSLSGENKIGAGIIIGSPTGLTGKLWLDSRDAIDLGLAFAFNHYFMLYSDYLVHYPGAFGAQNKFVAQLSPYFGIGGLIVVTSDDRTNDDGFQGKSRGSVGLGARVPLGIEWRPANPSVGVFVEVVPGVSIIPETTAILQAGLGIRYYF